MLLMSGSHTTVPVLYRYIWYANMRCRYLDSNLGSISVPSEIHSKRHYELMGKYRENLRLDYDKLLIEYDAML